MLCVNPSAILDQLHGLICTVDINMKCSMQSSSSIEFAKFYKTIEIMMPQMCS